MATIYTNASLKAPAESYSTYQEPDTKIPQKAAPLFDRISVNGVEIAEPDILAEAQNHPADNPGEALAEAARALVVAELLSQEAHRLGIEPPPERSADGGMETERDAAIRSLMEREIEVPLATEEECRRYYHAHPAKFRTEPLFEARHILLAAVRSEPQKRRNAGLEAAEICRMLQSHPKKFADICRDVSDCPSKAQDGVLGQLSRGSTVEEFEAALGAMEPGTISPEPVETRFGFHIIALDRRIDGAELPFEHVCERIAAWLEASSWAKAVSQYIAMLAGRAEIKGIDIERANSPLIQ